VYISSANLSLQRLASTKLQLENWVILFDTKRAQLLSNLLGKPDIIIKEPPADLLIKRRRTISLGPNNYNGLISPTVNMPTPFLTLQWKTLQQHIYDIQAPSFVFLYSKDLNHSNTEPILRLSSTLTWKPSVPNAPLPSTLNLR
jgi:hypothetical protein